jgi:hypothetical protein
MIEMLCYMLANEIHLYPQYNHSKKSETEETNYTEEEQIGFVTRYLFNEYGPVPGKAFYYQLTIHFLDSSRTHHLISLQRYALTCGLYR